MPWNMPAPGLLLRCEGATTLYGARGGSCLFFVVLLLVPDLSALGYLVNTVTGAALYNTAHTYAGPIALGAVGLVAGHPWVTPGALIWAAHIGMDRLLGYGLKEADAFTPTHHGGTSAGDGRRRRVARILTTNDNQGFAPRNDSTYVG